MRRDESRRGTQECVRYIGDILSRILMTRFLFLGVLAALLACSLPGQTTNGTIVGSVRDTSDLAVVNADIRLTHSTTGVTRRSASNDRGDFTFTNVVPGAYSLSISSPGFKTVERKGINLTATETLPLGGIRLEVGAV